MKEAGRSLKPGGFIVADCSSAVSMVNRPVVGCFDLDGVVRDTVTAMVISRERECVKSEGENKGERISFLIFLF